jgi:GLPGLI family protein
MKTIIILFFSLFTCTTLFAQQSKAIKSGSIEYDRTINTFALARQMLDLYPAEYRSMVNQGFEQYQKNKPQFLTNKSKLVFNNNKSLFIPEVPIENPVVFMNPPLTRQINMVYTDANTNKRVIQKEVLDDNFLVTDSVSKIVWKLTDQTQEIAGFTCRRANGLILDSVYVVAFYTDKIWMSGGPESFSGLPGMILKLSLPREHVTWTATKVTVADIPEATIVPPKKGKPTTNKQLYDTLKGFTKGRGPFGNQMLKVFML